MTYSVFFQWQKLVFLLMLFFLSPMASLADWESESKKVDELLKEIEKSEALFIRNDKEYDAKSAVQHLKMKLENAQKSWFSPPKEKWTAIMFIEKIASQSSLSGKPYLIKEKDKAPVPARTWLMEKLQQKDKHVTH